MTKADQARAIFNSRKEAEQILVTGDGTRKCSICGLVKNVDLEFYPRTSTSSEARPYCIMCDNNLRTEYNHKNR